MRQEGLKTQTLSRKELWEREIKWWGSENKIKDHWDMYKQLKHSYIHVDICESPEKITSKITPEEHSVIWWSNAFHTVNAQYVRGLQGVKDCYNNWISQIIEKNPNIWILGKDYLDRPVEGSQIKDYVINQSKTKIIFDNDWLKKLKFVEHTDEDLVNKCSAIAVKSASGGVFDFYRGGQDFDPFEAPEEYKYTKLYETLPEVKSSLTLLNLKQVELEYTNNLLVKL